MLFLNVNLLFKLMELIFLMMDRNLDLILIVLHLHLCELHLIELQANDSVSAITLNFGHRDETLCEKNTALTSTRITVANKDGLDFGAISSYAAQTHHTPVLSFRIIIINYNNSCFGLP